MKDSGVGQVQWNVGLPGNENERQKTKKMEYVGGKKKGKKVPCLQIKVAAPDISRLPEQTQRGGDGECHG